MSEDFNMLACATSIWNPAILLMSLIRRQSVIRRTANFQINQHAAPRATAQGPRRMLIDLKNWDYNP